MNLGPAELAIILVIVAVPVILIGAAIWLLSSNRRRATPRQLLDDRLARGEITPAEHDERARRMD